MITVRPYKKTQYFEYDINITTPTGEKFRERKNSGCKTEAGALRLGEQRYNHLVKTGFTKAELKKKAPLLGEFWPRYLAHQHAERRKPATIAMRRKQYTRYLLPLFSTYPLDKIGAEQFSQLKADLARLAPGSVNLALNTLSVVLKLAHEWKEIQAPPPCAGYLQRNSKESQPYSPEECKRLLGAAKTPHERAFLLLGLDAGLRVGEMSALRREDIDLEAKRMEIRNNLSEDKPATPKSESSKRTIYLTARLAEALTVQMKTHAAPRVLYHPDFAKQNTGDLQRLLGRVERRAGLPTGTTGSPHRLRHTFASLLAAAGATAKEIAALLGHASLRQAETYIHLYAQNRPRAISLLEQMAL